MTSGSPGRDGVIRLPARGRALLRRWLLSATVAILFAVGGLVLTAVIGAEVGAQAGLLAALVALLPLGLVVPSLLWLDSYESEPTRYLWFALLWGGLIATTLSLVLNTGSLTLLEATQVEGHEITAVVIAPVVEEVSKGSAVLLILLFRRREFDGLVDGLVYAGLSAAGFAFAENILYLGRAVIEGGVDGLVGVFVLRCVLGPFAHPLFTACTGVGIGLVAHRARGIIRVLGPVCGLLGAVLLHGLWNLSAVIGLDGYLTRYLVLQLPIFAAGIWFANWARRREGRLIGEYLRGYVDLGWLSAHEVTMLEALPSRRQAQAWARRTGGRFSYRAMREFQDDGSELALLRLRMVHGTAHPTARLEERALLDRMTTNRAVFLRFRRQGLANAG